MHIVNFKESVFHFDSVVPFDTELNGACDLESS